LISQKKKFVFFQILVQFNQASDQQAKNEFFRQLLGFQSFRNIRRTAHSEYQFFSNWVIVSLLEAINTDWAKKNPHEMALSLGVNDREIENALKTLKDLNLISKRGSRWVRKDNTIDTPPETGSLHIRNLHKQMSQKATESLDKDLPEERTHTGLTLSLSAKQYSKLRKVLLELPHELDAQFSGDLTPTKVYQVNLQLFPLVDLEK